MEYQEETYNFISYPQVNEYIDSVSTYTDAVQETLSKSLQLESTGAKPLNLHPDIQETGIPSGYSLPTSLWVGSWEKHFNIHLRRNPAKFRSPLSSEPSESESVTEVDATDSQSDGEAFALLLSVPDGEIMLAVTSHSHESLSLPNSDPDESSGSSLAGGLMVPMSSNSKSREGSGVYDTGERG
eukprot:TRINITY_DN11219_c0_g1_i1.p1 TRINITY_DN11219_c0_g1~~TRINITY_DN11219_c0_g1_i1.p1  ORF type:complete len:198 (-),score=51.19 TRINITY_DN11219_c0_g1_i1:46-597(-)